MHIKISKYLSAKEILIKEGNSEVYLIRNWLTPQEASNYFEKLHSEIKWQQELMRIFDKEINLPRLTAWYGDKELEYRYSGIIHKSSGWLRTLEDLRNRLQQTESVYFNSVLCNLYRNQKDSIGYHADNEPELGKNPTIASVSLGASRKFKLKHRLSKKIIEMELTSGSLLIMKGETQNYWQHSLPKTLLPCGERINLTFRYILRDYART